MNQEFGFINEVILGGANIPWLTDAWWGKLSILLVNLWLGYPYMFLVATGALQSIRGCWTRVRWWCRSCAPGWACSTA